MGRRALARQDEGAAVVEFVFLAVLLMVPIVYLVLTLARAQESAFAAEAVARDVSRAAVVGGVEALQDGATYAQAERAARERADAVLATTLGDFHLQPSDADVTLACTSSPCLQPGSDIAVDVTITVRLPGIGGLVPGAGVSLSSEGSSPVDGFAP